MSQLSLPEAFLGNIQPVPSRRVISRDEMNLAEFPLTVLSTRVDSSVKTLEFTDTVLSKNGESVERKWIITGADKFGLPTASDDEVLLGLMKLTVDSGFKDRKVFFSRYELLKILRWTTEGRSYTRLQRALDRLSGVRIKATNAFYDNESKSHSTRNFGIVDAYEINDGRSSEAKPSFFAWSEAMFKSFQVGFIKKLDLKFYLDLQSAVSKRLYRFLDKHFWYRSRLQLNLFVLAHEKVGISRNYQYASSLRQQLDPALEELQTHGFVQAFEYSGKGKNTEITIVSGSAQPRVLSRDTPRNERAEAAQRGSVLGSSERHTANASSESAWTSEGKAAFSSELAQGLARNLGASDVGVSGVPGIGMPGAASLGQGTATIVDFTEEIGSSAGSAEGRTSRGKIFGGEEFLALENQVLRALVDRGISERQAKRLTTGHMKPTLERILSIIAYYDRLRGMRSKLVSRSPVGFLYRAVERPETFVLPGEQGAGQTALPLNQGGRQDSVPKSRAASFSLGSAENIAETRASDRLTYLKAAYLEARKREAQQQRANMEPALLAKITAEVEEGLDKLRRVISDNRFREAVDHGIDERLVKMFLFPDFEEWLKQQGGRSRSRDVA